MPRMLEGEWQGTMALTEPEAGSSLSDITTIAEPTDEGYYRIQGQKIFISAGDHEAVENVIHLMLAKIKGAPAGVKGISLFVVPKKRIEDGRLVPNDVVVSGIFHKLGYRGCPATQLSIGDGNDCRGYLVGEPNHGLKYMFQMMNEARIGVGMGAAAMATAAYYAALEYSRERRQGRPVSAKDPSQPQIPIIEHPDVRRMLLSQRAITEGVLSLLLQCFPKLPTKPVARRASTQCRLGYNHNGAATRTAVRYASLGVHCHVVSGSMGADGSVHPPAPDPPPSPPSRVSSPPSPSVGCCCGAVQPAPERHGRSRLRHVR